MSLTLYKYSFIFFERVRSILSPTTWGSARRTNANKFLDAMTVFCYVSV